MATALKTMVNNTVFCFFFCTSCPYRFPRVCVARFFYCTIGGKKKPCVCGNVLWNVSRAFCKFRSAEVFFEMFVNACVCKLENLRVSSKYFWADSDG